MDDFGGRKVGRGTVLSEHHRTIETLRQGGHHDWTKNDELDAIMFGKNDAATKSVGAPKKN